MSYYFKHTKSGKNNNSGANLVSKSSEALPAAQQAPRRTPKKGIDDRPDLSAILPGKRQSIPDYNGSDSIYNVANEYSVISPDQLCELIPLIRTLAQLNPDVSQALHNIVSLGNTGHKVFFDKKVKPELVDQMRNHLRNKRRNWAPGQAGMDGFVNKLFSQLMIGGALSGEWVPNNDLTGIRGAVLINPENVVFKLDPDKITYRPYQRVKNSILQKPTPDNLIPLNPNTFQYYALNGDGENPHGFPPYLPVIKRVESQGKMNQNIDFIVDIVGLVGFLEVLIQKPDQLPNEKVSTYEARLENMMRTAKDRIMGGLKDGVVVGIKDEHEFKFNSASKTFDQVTELYKQNEMQIASAVKQDASLWGRDYGTSEAKANVTFIKMISELKNMQNIISAFLEFGYSLELKMAGFEFDYLKVQFNRSTLQDDYKYQQAEEIKVKNTQNKLILGLITQEDAADELGYESPAYPQPRVPFEVLAGSSVPKPGEPTQKVKRQGQKNKSAKKTRDNKKSVTKN